MMPKNFTESQPSLPVRSIKANFAPQLPEGCTWTLWAQDRLLASGKVDPPQRSSLLVTTTYAGDAELKLIVSVPITIGQCSVVQDHEGGLVIIDNLETTQCNPRPSAKFKPVIRNKQSQV
jgi:hypothetical protein